jgi:hypothetical protein
MYKKINFFVKMKKTFRREMLKMETEVTRPKFINVKEAEAARQANNTAKVNRND